MSGEDRRRQLLRSAVETFARLGFAGTKTRDIAAAAGVSEAIVFRHFATKVKLYHAILDAREDKEATARLNRELEDCADRRDDVAVFRNIAMKILREFREEAAFHRLIVYAALEGHILANLFRKRVALPTGGFLKRYIVLRQKEGAFRKCDPQIATMFALGTIVHFAMGRYVFGMKRFHLSDDAVMDELVELVMGGLRKHRKGNRAQ